MSNGGGSDFLTVIVLLIAGYVVVVWIVAAVILIATAAYYAALFITFALSALCLLTLRHRVHIGRLSLGPQQSQPFIARGIIGAVLLPAFGVCCHLFLDRPVPVWMWPHLFTVGWALGSVGIGLIEDDLVAYSQDGHGRGFAIEHEPRPALTSRPAALRAPASGSRAVATREDRPAAGPTSPAPEQAPSAAPPCPAVAAFRFAAWDDEEEMRARAAREAAAKEKEDTDPTLH